MNSLFSYTPWSPLAIEQVEEHGQHLVINLHSVSSQATCPTCQQTAMRLHSHAQRSATDLPLAGKVLQLQLHLRRYFCDNRACPRRTFREQFPDLLPAYAHRTQRLQAAHRQVAYANGGEA